MQYPTTRRRAVQAALTMAIAASAGPAMSIPLSAQTPKILTVGSAFSPRSMDPALSGNGRAGIHLSPAYEALVRTKADGSFAPALATAWEMTPDSKSVTFTLRQNAKFSDGEPVNAEAAKKSIEYFKAKKGPFSANLATMTSIDILDPFKFRINMSAPQPNLISLFDPYFLAADLISPKGIETPDKLGTQTFGAGPYKLDTAATITGKSYTYVQNEHYYDKSRQHWDKVIVSVFEDQNSGVQAMKSGQLLLLSSDPLTGNSNAANLPKDLRLVSDPVGWTGLIFNDRDGSVQPEMKDVRVRQAINHALDRKLITKALFGNLADGTVQLQSRGFMGYDAKLEERYPYDLAKAKELLTAAGYPNGFELKLAYVNNTMSNFLQQAVGAQLKKAGISVKTQELQNFGAMDNAAAAKQFAALLFNSNSGVPNLAKFQTLDPKGGLNFYGSQDETLAKLIAEASNLPIDKAEAAWQKVYGHVVEIAWFAPVAAIHVVYFASEKIKTPAVGASIVIDLTDIEPAK